MSRGIPGSVRDSTFAWGRGRVLRGGVPGALVVLLGAVALAACEGEEVTVRRETTIDTIAGVVHVRHEGSAPEWGLEPVVEIGAMGGVSDAPSPDEFGRIARVIGDGEGRVYVADQMPPEIRVFGPDGGHVRTVGRKGAGPGEFGGLYGVAWLAPDTFLVVDPRNARVAALTVDGEPIDQWDWAPLSGPAKMYLFNGGPGEAYTLVLRSGTGEERLSPAWGRFTLDGPPDTLEIPTAESLGVELPENAEICRTEQMIGFQDNPYAASVLKAPAPELERVVAVSDAYRLAFIDAEGDTVRVISRAVPAVPLPDSARASVEAEIEEFRTRYHGADCEGEIAETDVLPILRDLYFDHHGRLLVEYNRPEGVAFDLFDRDGRWIATFPAPDRDRSVPPYLYDDRLYTVARDSLDVQRVRVHRTVAPER